MDRFIIACGTFGRGPLVSEGNARVRTRVVALASSSPPIYTMVQKKKKLHDSYKLNIALPDSTN